MTENDNDIVAAIFKAWPSARILGKASYMIDPTAREIRAIELASDPAGEYIDSLGKTDMAAWDESEWYTFLEVVITGYQDGLVSSNNEHRHS
jgi:hypothetical protein